MRLAPVQTRLNWVRPQLKWVRSQLKRSINAPDTSRVWRVRSIKRIHTLGTPALAFIVLASLAMADSDAPAPEDQPLATNTEHVSSRPNETLAAYRSRRDQTGQTSSDQATLALWCHNVGLLDESRAHFLAAARRAIDYDDQAKYHHAAGDSPHESGWMSPHETQQFEALAAARESAKKTFGSRFEEYRRIITREPRSAAGKRAAAEMAAFRGPQAEWLIQQAFADARGPAAFVAIDALKDRPTVESARVLADFAINMIDKPARTAAARSLRSRDWAHFIPAWLDRLHTPLRANQVQLIDDRGEIITTWTVESETRHARKRAILNTDVELKVDLKPFIVRIREGGRLNSQALARALNESQANFWAEYTDEEFFDALPYRERRAFERAAHDNANAEITGRIRKIRDHVAERNTRVRNALRQVDGGPKSPTADLEAIWNWWQRYNGMADIPSASDREVVEIEEDETVVEVYEQPAPRYVASSSCFAAGTIVWAEQGPVAIETLQTGDRVLSRNLETGDDQWSIVLYPTIRTTTEKYDLRFTEETLRSSAAHPFWNVASGWQRAKLMTVGAIYATADTPAFLESIQPLKVGTPEMDAPVYNLLVDQTHTYYVGQSKLLVHDDSVPKPRDAIELFRNTLPNEPSGPASNPTAPDASERIEASAPEQPAAPNQSATNSSVPEHDGPAINSRT